MTAREQNDASPHDMTLPLTILSTKVLGWEARGYAHDQGWKLLEEEFIELRSLYDDWLTSYDGGEKHFSHQRQAETFQNFSRLSDSLRTMADSGIVVFTSENGIKYLPWHRLEPLYHPNVKPLRTLPGTVNLWRVACLEGRTLTAALERLREEQIVCTARNGQELAERIIGTGRFTKVFFFSAREHRPELTDTLKAAGIDVVDIPVYETIGKPKVIDTPYDGVLYFSPSAVESFFQLNQLPPNAVCFAIGQTTAGAIKDYTDARIIVSETPSQEALLACVRFYFDNQQCYE